MRPQRRQPMRKSQVRATTTAELSSATFSRPRNPSNHDPPRHRLSVCRLDDQVHVIALH
jgi:hypothetical protein